MSEAFHPDRNLPDCMMPDGGECCTGHAAVCEDWHKQRATISRLTAELEGMRKALEDIARVPSVRHTSGHLSDCAWCNGSAGIARAALTPSTPI